MGVTERISPGIMLLMLMVSMGACSSIQLVSTYDEVIDAQAQSLQKKLDSHLTSLQIADDDQLKYKSNKKFYMETLTDLNAMSVRASAIYNNKLTIEQIRLVKTNLAYLVLLNKKCVNRKLTEEQINKVDENGVDLSMNCNIEKGATQNETARGEQKLNPLTVPAIQDQFNQLFGYIMALELDKKHGEGEGSLK
jgi:archaellum component FlaF (FlaF/FlaG flagellin family)